MSESSLIYENGILRATCSFFRTSFFIYPRCWDTWANKRKKKHIAECSWCNCDRTDMPFLCLCTSCTFTSLPHQQRERSSMFSHRPPAGMSMHSSLFDERRKFASEHCFWLVFSFESIFNTRIFAFFTSLVTQSRSFENNQQNVLLIVLLIY